LSGAAALTIGADQTAFWRGAYEQHGPSVLAFLRSRVGNRDDAEELLQETFVRAIRAGDRLREKDRVRGYLFTTAHNLIRNRARRLQAAPAIIDSDQEIADRELSDTRASLRSLCERLDAVLDTLSDEHRRAFELGVLEKLPYREISERTGWTLSQVKINIYRARRQVIAELTEYLPTADT
jgi:RNA polymerase sigma-70 factor (ECF subfamily)